MNRREFLLQAGWSGLATLAGIAGDPDGAAISEQIPQRTAFVFIGGGAARTASTAIACRLLSRMDCLVLDSGKPIGEAAKSGRHIRVRGALHGDLANCGQSVRAACDHLLDALEGAERCVVLACLGGMLGSVGLPEVLDAMACRQMPFAAVAQLPFEFEGWRLLRAAGVIATLVGRGISPSVIDTKRVVDLLPNDISMLDAFDLLNALSARHMLRLAGACRHAVDPLAGSPVFDGLVDARAAIADLLIDHYQSGRTNEFAITSNGHVPIWQPSSRATAVNAFR